MDILGEWARMRLGRRVPTAVGIFLIGGIPPVVRPWNILMLRTIKVAIVPAVTAEMGPEVETKCAQVLVFGGL